MTTNQSSHPQPGSSECDFYRLKSEILTAWIAALNGGEEPVREGLGILGRYGGFDRVGLVLFSPDGLFGQTRVYWNSDRWIYDRDTEFYSLVEYPWLMRQLRSGGTVLMKSLAELPSQAASEKEYFHNHGIRTFAAKPLFHDPAGPVTGFLHLDDTAKENNLDDTRLYKVMNVFDVIESLLPVLRVQEKIDLQKSLIEEKDILLNNTDVQMWYMLNPTVYGGANASHARFFGKTCAEMTRAETYSMFDISAGNMFADFTMDVFEKKIPLRRELALKNADGQERILFISWNPLLDVRQEVSHVVCSAQDITDLKKTQELARANEALKKEIAERKSAEERLEAALFELRNAQSQIIQQEKMASIGQLAAGVAHEINNPMGFIISNLASFKKHTKKLNSYFTIQNELLSKLSTDNIAEPAQEQLTRLCEKLHEIKRTQKIDYILQDIEDIISESEEGAERVKRIVQDLKGFTRIANEDNSLADINAGLESTINIIGNELKFKAELVKEYGDIPALRCNSGQLNQVFMNILLNAVQAMDTQGEIHIKTWCDAAWVWVSISDTGCGMPPEVMKRIFDPFFTTKDVGKGTGLGLNVSYEIIKKHNGEILVDSQVGKGTTFTVKIPLT
ncbi:MAG TPA: ATP-binding protein [Patescibacteria group bacterium]|nr:ATP-binding protein [Patescibacteria group bacterium]